MKIRLLDRLQCRLKLEMKVMCTKKFARDVCVQMFFKEFANGNGVLHKQFKLIRLPELFFISIVPN